MHEQSILSSSPRKIRQNNVIAALQALFEHGRLSRAQLARHLGINRSSSGNIISELVANALVREVADEDMDRSRRAGRPGIFVEIDPRSVYFIGAEIGVEHITTLHVDLMANLVACKVELFDGRSVSAAEAVERAVAQAFRDLPPDIAERVEGFGISAPAQMDRNGRVRIAPLLGWEYEDLGAITRNALGSDMPIVIDNDANAFAFGESYRCHAAKTGVALVLVIETGVGGCIVIDGKVFRGGHGLAGELGHLNVPGGKELEQVLGLEHLIRSHKSSLGLEESSLGQFLADVRDRVPGAVSIAEDWASNLAQALVAAMRVIDPDRIVLGGSVSALYPLVKARLAHHIAANQASNFPMPDVMVHDAAETGAAFGAACMMHRRFFSLENQTLVEQPGNHAPQGN